MDMDHILDYYLQQGVTHKIKDIYLWCEEEKAEFLFLFLHSLELVLLLWISIPLFDLGVLWTALAIGLTQHMLLDVFFNPLHSYAYLLSYRIIKGFKREYLFK